jgi:hypothetical protein
MLFEEIGYKNIVFTREISWKLLNCGSLRTIIGFNWREYSIIGAVKETYLKYVGNYNQNFKENDLKSKEKVTLSYSYNFYLI